MSKKMVWCMRYKETWHILTRGGRPANVGQTLQEKSNGYVSRAVLCEGGKGRGGLPVFEYKFRKTNCGDCLKRGPR